MREIQVIKWCDGEHEERVAADITHTISVDGSKEFEIDLCYTCDTVMVLPLLSVAEEVLPKKKRGPKKQDLTTTCSICGFVSSSRDALGVHARRTHNKGLRELA